MEEYKQHKTMAYSFLGAAGKTVYLSVLTMLCLYSALWMIQDVFPDWQISQSAQRWICIFVILTAAVYEIGIQALPRGRQLCRLLPPLFLATAVYRYARISQIDFEDGLCAFGTQFLEKFNKQMGTSIIIWRGKPELLGMALAVCMFGIVLALLILTLISKRNLFLLLPAFVLGAELLVGYAPQWKGLSCFFASVVAASAGAADAGRIQLRGHRSGQKRGAAAGLWNIAALLGTAAAVPLILAGSSAVFQGPAARFLEQAPKARAFQRNLEQNIEAVVPALFEKSRVNVQNSTPHYTGREVMKITVTKEPAEDLYLKGFYGTEYRDGGWIRDQQAFTDACRQAGYSPQQAAEELLQAEHDVLSESLGRIRDILSKTASTGPEPNNMREMIRNMEADYILNYTGIWNKHAYMPYMIDLSQSRSRGSLSGDALVQKPWGMRQTEISGLNYAMDSYLIQFADQAAERKVFQWYDAFANHAYVKSSGHIPAIGEYVEHINTAAAGLMIPSEEFLNIVNNTKVWMERTGRAGRNQGRLFLAQYIGMLLKHTLQYSMDLPPLPDGEDAVHYFLTESHKGYCVHFASAAVLMLRQQGVPARYASGYVVRRADFYESGDVYAASVKDNAAHAWVEIYLDGIGWIPMDVTPGDSAHMTDAQQTDSKEAGNQEDQESTRPGGTDTDDTDTDDTKTDTDTDDTKTDDAADDTRPGDTQTEREQTGNRIKDILKLACLAAGLAVLILLFSYAVRRYQNMLQNDLRAGKNRSAVLRINRRLYRKLMMQRFMIQRPVRHRPMIRGPVMRGKIRRVMTDTEYEQMLKEAFPDVPEKNWTRYMQIVQAAVFAAEEPGPGDAWFCYHIYRNL